jgi:hypothetical protein
MSRPCQAEDSDGDECDCETFAPKSTNPKLCRRCLHAKKQHPVAEDSIASILLQAKTDHDSSMGGTTKLAKAKQESIAGMRPKKGPQVRLILLGYSALF